MICNYHDLPLELFHLTSRNVTSVILVSQNNETAAILVPKPVLWELCKKLFFLPINLHICWPREWKGFTLASSSRQF